MHFPLFVDLTGKTCLVVGGGNVACRKAESFLRFGARVKAVAPAFSPGFAAVAAERTERAFAPGDVEGAALAVAATDDGAVNAAVAEACRARGIPVNVVDDPAKSTFIFPALCVKDPVTVAVSTGGASPVAAQVLRDRIAGILTDGFAARVAALGRDREELKRTCPDVAERRRVCRARLECL